MAKELRPYQKEAHDAINHEFERHGSTLCCLPTGTGKTFTAAKWVADNAWKTLWLAHRNELIDQALSAFEELKVNVTPWTADKKDASGDVVVATIGSARELHKELPEVDLMVPDEAHHWPMPSYSGPKGIINRIKTNKLLGLTATPTRLDRKELGFDSVAYQKSFLEMVVAKWLAKPNYVPIRTDFDVEFKKTSGEFTQASLSQINNEARNQVIKGYWDKHREELGKTLMFAANIEHAEELARRTGAVAVTQRTSARDRKRAIEAFRRGEIRALTNCLVYTEGLDVPDINTVILARPTASQTLYMQMIGRGSRICEGKTSFNVIDVVDNDRHYSMLSKQWSMDELGAGGNLEEMVSRKERVAKFATDNKLNIKKLTVRYNIGQLDIAGILWYQDFRKNEHVIPLKLAQVESVLMFQEEIASEWNLTKDLIFTAYSMYAAASGFQIPLWKEICHAIWHTIKGNGRYQSADLTMFCGDQIINQKGAREVRLTEIERVNSLVAGNEDKLKADILDKLKDFIAPRLHNTFCEAKFRYVNCVIEVILPIKFVQIRYFLPARFLIREIANEILDTEIIHVSYGLSSGK